MTVLEVRELAVRFGDVLAVQGVEFDVARGEVLGIVGESGSGKSVSALAVLGLLPPRAVVTGSVRLHGRELLGAPEKELTTLRGKAMAMVFQDPLAGLTPVYRVGDQVAEAIRAHQDVSRKNARACAVELLDLVGIPEPKRRARAFPHEFSGGMRQRVMIAMAIANHPDLIICDEPTTALDVTVQAQILDVLRTARHETGAAILFVTHDLGIVAGLADRVLVMRSGHVVETGPVDDLFYRPRTPYIRTLLAAVPRIDDPAPQTRAHPDYPEHSDYPGSPNCFEHSEHSDHSDLLEHPDRLEPSDHSRHAGRHARPQPFAQSDYHPGRSGHLQDEGGQGGAGFRDGRDDDDEVQAQGGLDRADQMQHRAEDYAPQPTRLSRSQPRHAIQPGGLPRPVRPVHPVQPGGPPRLVQHVQPGGAGRLVQGVQRFEPGQGGFAPGVVERSGELVLEVEGLVKRYGRGAAVVDGVSFEVRAGETLGLVGESGCGKTTLLMELLALGPPQGGRVVVLGRDTAELTGRERLALRRDVQVVFQDPMASLDPRMTVHDIVAEPLRTHGLPIGQVAELLRLVGLEAGHAARYPHDFSGGQRQRIAIARALALAPRLLVLDEPVSALDVSIRAEIIELLAELKARRGISYLFVAHDLAVVRRIADRVAVMYSGRIVEIGPVERIFAEPRHPYTRALLAAVPVPDPVRERARSRVPLSGDPPGDDPLRPARGPARGLVRGPVGAAVRGPVGGPVGCRFRSRCPVYAGLSGALGSRCVSEEPELGGADGAACHHPSGGTR